MKKRYTTVLLYALIYLSGCRSSDIDDEYFVKYILDSDNYFNGHIDDFKVVIKSASDNDQYIIKQNDGLERLVGPVKKGFKASLNIRPLDGTQSSTVIKGEIHVSKNGDDFSLKMRNYNDEFGDDFNVEYTIDY